MTRKALVWLCMSCMVLLGLGCAPTLESVRQHYCSDWGKASLLPYHSKMLRRNPSAGLELREWRNTEILLKDITDGAGQSEVRTDQMWAGFRKICKTGMGEKTTYPEWYEQELLRESAEKMATELQALRSEIEGLEREKNGVQARFSETFRDFSKMERKAEHLAEIERDMEMKKKALRHSDPCVFTLMGKITFQERQRVGFYGVAVPRGGVARDGVMLGQRSAVLRFPDSTDMIPMANIVKAENVCFIGRDWGTNAFGAPVQYNIYSRRPPKGLARIERAHKKSIRKLEKKRASLGHVVVFLQEKKKLRQMGRELKELQVKERGLASQLDEVRQQLAP